MNEQNYGAKPGGYGQPAGAPMYASSSGGYPPPPSGGYPPPSGGGYPPPVGGYPPPGQPPYGQQQYGGPPPPPPPPQGSGLPPNTAAAVAYITFIPAIIFLVMDPYKRSSFVRFHAWQCIVLTGFSIAWGTAVTILTIILAVAHVGILAGLLHVLSLLVNLAVFIFWLISIIKASKGERYHIPVLGDIAEKFAGQV